MRQRGLAAIAAAALLGFGVGAPAAAQSCEQFGSQKEAQQSLEQAGDQTGLLDPDFNGFACEGAAFTATVAQEAGPDSGMDGMAGADAEEGGTVEETSDDATSLATGAVGAEIAFASELTLNEDGPATSDDAAGDSGVTTQISTDDGSETEIGRAPVADVPTATDDGVTSEAATGDAAAVDGPDGSMAMAGDAVAIDEEEPKAIKPKPEKAVKQIEEVKKVEDVAVPVAATIPVAPAAPAPAPVQLPDTGTGAGLDDLGRSLALLGASILLGVALLAARRLQRA